MSKERTKVYITVDVECAEERILGGRVQPAMGYDLRMWGRLANVREELGVGLIMDELDATGAKGTFFVEPLGSHHFGSEGLEAVCKAIHGRGHDVQLHLHPVQRHAEWHSRGQQRTPDDIAAYPPGEQAALLREGKAILVRCGIPEGQLLGYRAGNFGASNDTWRAMKDVGLVLSSNYNPCYFSKNCLMRVDAPEPGLFPTEVEGVWELPIANFVERRGGYRHLQITAVSLDEMKEHLWQCRRLGIGEACVVTHSFEFFFLDSIKEKKGHKNLVNVARLRGLCRFLENHADDFEVDTVGALAARLPGMTPKKVGNVYPRMPMRHTVRRFAEQAVKRVAARVAL